MTPIQACWIRCAEQDLAELDLRAQDLEDVARPGLAGGCQSPQRRAPDEHGARAQRKRHQHVRSAPDAAVHEHLDASVDRLDALGQQVDRRLDRVELATPVVGDDDARGAVLAGQPRVLGGLDALEEHRHRAVGDQLLQVAGDCIATLTQPAPAVSTGTPAGVGPMKTGDVVEVEIGGIGRLRSPVL